MGRYDPYTEKDYNTGPLNILAAEKKLIILAITKFKTKQEVASKLGISERKLFDKLKRHQIDADKIRNEKKNNDLWTTNGPK
jgi:DNA-binding NtrC family response regulator